ncbi:hypothetical protein BDV11DRAFT_95607 [Aspergillus similis]
MVFFLIIAATVDSHPCYRLMILVPLLSKVSTQKRTRPQERLLLLYSITENRPPSSCPCSVRLYSVSVRTPLQAPCACRSATCYPLRIKSFPSSRQAVSNGIITF